MLQTLFHIPHEINGIPVFGFGWLLALWLLVLVVLGVATWCGRIPLIEVRNHAMILGILGLAIIFLKRLEETDLTGNSIGLPIRGYGFMLLLGVLSGVWLATYRARRMGIDPEKILSLAFWMFLVGIVGARLFYVIEFWDQFQRESLLETLKSAIQVTEGGLVVYGSLIGASIAAAVYLRRQRLPILAVADLISPSLVVGLSFGRIGCLLNGCCFGQVSDLPWAITFPQSSAGFDSGRFSPPFYHQLQSGQFHGLRIESDQNGRPFIADVAADSAAAMQGLSAGNHIVSINGSRVKSLNDVYATFLGSPTNFVIQTDQHGLFEISIATLPARTLSVHPTQIYSAINAVFLCLFLMAYYPYRRRDGEVIALCLTIYPVARILIEMIRSDANIAFELTISQIVSIGLLTGIVGLWLYLFRQTPGSALPP